MAKLFVTMLIMAVILSGCAAAGEGSQAVGAPTTSAYQAVVDAAATVGTTATVEAAATVGATATVGTTGAPATATSLPAVEPVATDLSDFEEATTIALGEAIQVAGPGVAVSGSTVTITAGGAYRLSGALRDGQLIVQAPDTDKVKVLLSGVDITCSNSAPIYIISAEKVTLTLADGTQNTVTDSESYALAEGEDEPNAAIFSKEDLTINGNGALVVNVNHDHGIASKDSLKITAGNITVNAVGDGLRGKDEVTIKDATIAIQAGGDGIQSSNDADPERGFVAIESGTLQITAGLDGIQAETSLTISGGAIAISTGGGSANSSQNRGGMWGRAAAATADTPSAKGLKGVGSVTIDGGVLVIDSSDDAIHSNGTVTINGGEITIASGDDGVHADTKLEINGGAIAIAKSYEGLESAVIVIHDGNIHVAASDDGLNVAGGADGSAMGGRPGQGMFNASSGQYLEITGGYLAVDAQGDGLDSNGTIKMSGGTAIVNGPTSNGNGALDHAGFQMTGGFLLAVGSAGMAQAPDASSTQYALMVNLNGAQAAGALVHIQSQDGKQVLTFAPTKPYQSVVFSSPDLQKGGTYTISIGGKATGSATDGLYSSGSYTGGSQAASLTISSIITTYGSAGMGGFGGGRPGRQP